MNGGGSLPEPVQPVEDKSAGSPYAVLKNRDFFLYLTGRFIASFGQQMLAVIVGWEIYDRTHSTLALAWVGLAQIVPMFLFIFPAGHVADNYNRKLIIIWMQLLFGVACAGLAVVSALRANVAWMYCCLFVMGTARTYIWPAERLFSFLNFSSPQAIRQGRKLDQRLLPASCGCPAPVAGGAMVAFTHSAVSVYVFNAVAAVLCALLIANGPGPSQGRG